MIKNSSDPSFFSVANSFQKNFGQNDPKIRPLSKNFGSFVKIASLNPFNQNMTKFFKPYQ